MPWNLRQHVHNALDWLRRVATQPRSELTRWQRAARFAYDLTVYGARQLKQDRAPQMAGALAFRTLFGLLPVLVVATVLFKATQGTMGVQEFVRQVAESFNLDAIQFVADGGETPDPAANGETSTLADWLEARAGVAANINFTAIGLVGLVVMIYAAISLMVTIEGCFNTIYRAARNRSLWNSLLVYWAVLTLGPLVILMSFWVDRQFDAVIQWVGVWDWALTLATIIWSLLVTWLAMIGFYKLVPNTKSQTKPILIGALVAAVMIQIGTRGLGAYLENAVSFRQLYGSLGLIPVFMLWVYVMWLVVLFGLEVAYALQALHGRRIEELEQSRTESGLFDPAKVVVIAEVVAEEFREGRVASARFVAEEVAAPEETVDRVLERLASEGIVHRVDGAEDAYTLARPPEQIHADDLLRIGYAMADEGRPPETSGVLARLREAQLSLARKIPMAQAGSGGET